MDPILMRCLLRLETLNLLAIIVTLFSAASCGTAVPDIKEIGDSDIPANIEGKISPKITGSAQIEYEVIGRIFCDLQVAVQDANRYYVFAGASAKGKFSIVQAGLFPRNWGAQVAISLQVEESSALNPGVTLNQILPNAVKVFSPGDSGQVITPQTSNFWLGAELSATSTRRRVTYVFDTDLIRFAKFVGAVLAIFLVVGAYLFGFKLDFDCRFNETYFLGLNLLPSKRPVSSLIYIARF
jgi:hypothetical protein